MTNHHDTSHTGRTTAGSAVFQDVALHCDDEFGRPMAFMATAHYDPTDPYAVGLTFHIPAGDMPWLMARSLLRRGLVEPVGEGDIVLWPAVAEDGRAVVGMDFHTPEGHLLAEVRSGELLDFLSRTYDLVPHGQEHLDVDELVASLLV